MPQVIDFAPGGMEVWDVDGVLHLVSFTPQIPGFPNLPPAPLAWRIRDADAHAELQGKFGATLSVDRTMTADQFTRSGAIDTGTSDELRNYSTDPFSVIAADFEIESAVQPWLKDPEVWATFLEAIAEGRTPTRAELASTNYFQTHSARELDWAVRKATDPRGAERDKQELYETVGGMLRANGITSPSEKLVTTIANRWISGRWSESYARLQIAALSDPYSGITIAPVIYDVLDIERGTVGRDLAQALNVDPSGGLDRVDQMIRHWVGPIGYNGFTPDQRRELAARIRNDPNAERELMNTLQAQAEAMFPSWKETGKGYEDIVSPWRGVFTSVWGQQPDELDPFFMEIVNTGDQVEAMKKLRTVGLQRNIPKVHSDALNSLTRVLGRPQIREAV